MVPAPRKPCFRPLQAAVRSRVLDPTRFVVAGALNALADFFVFPDLTPPPIGRPFVRPTRPSS